MRIHRLLWSLAVGLGLACALLVVLDASRFVDAQGGSSAVTRYVLDDGGLDTGDCTDWNAPCQTIQYALGQAESGDIIQVANKFSAAVYRSTIVITKSVTLEGGWNATPFPHGLLWNRPSPCEAFRTTLDTRGDGRVISITGHITPTIDCFTITGGNANGLGGDPSGNNAGGGIYSQDAAPIIVNNVITGNYGCMFPCTAYGRGGGIYLLNAPQTAVISGNLIADNVADESTWGQGGGIMLQDSEAQILYNTIRDNRAGLTAGYGGGIAALDSGPTIADNEILTNVANIASSAVQGLGGGIFVWSTMPVTIEHNLVRANRALSGTGSSGLLSYGGGIYVSGNPTVSVVIRDNTILYNAAATNWTGDGGGMYLKGLGTSSVVSGNTVEGNVAGFNDDGRGGGMFVDNSEVTITDNQILGNFGTPGGSFGAGGGLYANGGDVVIQNNVITGNLAATVMGMGYGGGVAISGSLAVVQDNWIADNRATFAFNGGAGGGIYGYLGTLQIVGNVITGNHGSWGDFGTGGGVYLEWTLPWLDGNTIVDNEAANGNDGRGGGVRINACSLFTMTNNIVARNDASARGSGIAIAYSTGQLAHNTIAENLAGDGVGVRVDWQDSDVVLYNNIIVSQTVGISNTEPASSTVGAKYTLFEDNGLNYGAGVDSIYEVSGPAALLADYHLGSGSGAIDAAPALMWVTSDVDGDPRPIGPLPDVGADEYWPHLYLPLVLRYFP